MKPHNMTKATTTPKSTFNTSLSTSSTYDSTMTSEIPTGREHTATTPKSTFNTSLSTSSTYDSTMTPETLKGLGIASVFLLFLLLCVITWIVFKRRRRPFFKPRTTNSVCYGDHRNDTNSHLIDDNSERPAITAGNSDYNDHDPALRQARRNDNMVIYNEIDEDKYNVLFAGKERGDYHVYNVADQVLSTSGRSSIGPPSRYQALPEPGCRDVENQGQGVIARSNNVISSSRSYSSDPQSDYQALLKPGDQNVYNQEQGDRSTKVTSSFHMVEDPSDTLGVNSYQALLDIGNQIMPNQDPDVPIKFKKGITSTSPEQDDAYQALQLDDSSYTTLCLKPSIQNGPTTYQALHVERNEAEHAILEPKRYNIDHKQSENKDSFDDQALCAGKKDPDYDILEKDDDELDIYSSTSKMDPEYTTLEPEENQLDDDHESPHKTSSSECG